MTTRKWKVYGEEGHRQRESFFESRKMDFSEGEEIRVIEILNSDVTGTNDYSIIKITRNTYDECQDELNGQISDGIFENSNVGKIEEVLEKSQTEGEYYGNSKRIIRIIKRTE
jgi:flagellar basal body rod protein FlgG